MKSEYIQKEVFIFDLDRTLAESKSNLDAEMATLLNHLLDKKYVAVISGGAFPQFKNQVINQLDLNDERRSHLVLLPTSGAQMYLWSGNNWEEIYTQAFSDEEREEILSLLEDIFERAGVERPEEVYGDIVEDRRSQITLSALGQKAPYEKKRTWDPDTQKRKKMVQLLAPKLPDFNVTIGGSTSIDIIKKGINKAYGVEQVSQHLEVPISKMLFIGDRIMPGGNDYSVLETGIDVYKVESVEDTKSLIKNLVM